MFKTFVSVLSGHASYFNTTYDLLRLLFLHSEYFSDKKRKFDNIMPDLLIIVLMIKPLVVQVRTC